jgi:hypothetical protein
MIPTSVLSQYECEETDDKGQPIGTLAILNCGQGDMVISFEKGNAEDRERARKAVEDMLGRGYTIVVQTPDGYKPVKKFDGRRSEYVVRSSGNVPEKTERIPAAKAKATAIAPTSGG